MIVRVWKLPCAVVFAALIIGLPAPRANALGTLPTGFTDVEMAPNLTAPVGLCFLPDGRALVTEQRLNPFSEHVVPA